MAMTSDELRSRLNSGPQGAILLEGEQIGRFVTFGRGRGRGLATRTVYATRIYRHGCAIEEEAGSLRVLLDKTARALARAMKAGKWSAPAPAPAPSLPTA